MMFFAKKRGQIGRQRVSECLPLVRAVLALVAQGEAPLGIVYETDATAEPKVKIVDIFPEDTHPPIIYPIAAIAASKNADAAKAFIGYLKSAEGETAFTKQGFTILK